MTPKPTTDLATAPTLPTAEVLTEVLLGGDLSKLSDAQRLAYYRSVCDSLGLNPLTQPFAYIKLSGKLVLYARKDAAEQLRRKYDVSLSEPRGELVEGIWTVYITARLPNGRTDADLGAVDVSGLKGENRANAMLKAITKAKRRVTLSICGLGMLDETEVDSIPGAERVQVNVETGEIVEDVRPISKEQQKRLFAVAHEVGWKDDELKAFLTARGVTSTAKIPRNQYDAIVAALAEGHQPNGAPSEASS